MCEYTGNYRSKISDIVKQNGGELHFDVTFLQRDTIAHGYFFLDNGQLRLSAEGSLFHNITDMYITLHECGYGVNNSTGAGETGGNAANCVSGNFNMFDNIITEFKASLLELVIGDNNPRTKVKTARISKPKEPRMLKADKRIMRPENATKGGNVWNPEYIKTKEIDVNRCYELWGGKTEFYTAMKTMTVYEFEATYGLRPK